MKTSIQTQYERWLAHPQLPADLRSELERIAEDEQGIYDRFYQDLEFGTGGLRGMLGAGTNRMNIYTVRRATQGLAEYIKQISPDAARQGVVIGYDCRRMSQEFALEVGLVFVANGVQAHVFPHLCPTPVVSYAVRRLGAAGGVMITASHNPSAYNGYKVYGSDGGQVLPPAANAIIAKIEAIQDIFSVPIADRDEAERAGRLTWVEPDLENAYADQVVQQILVPDVSAEDRAALRVVYTPLHGTGYVPVKTVLHAAGYSQTAIVSSQAEPDGEFSTVRSPNPEEPDALQRAIDLARSNQADLVMGTDPDADRVGIAVRDRTGDYRLLTGNQTGGLMLDFLLLMHNRLGTLPQNAIVFKTIVTSELGAAVAQYHGVAVEDTLTGFKYIGDRIGHYERTGEKTFLFGYEESYGYLIHPFVRDKDAVQTCLLLAEMAAWYKRQGLTLLDGLERLYGQVGWFAERLISITMPGADGLDKIHALMHLLRTTPQAVSGLELIAVEDYEMGERTILASTKAGSLGHVERLELPQSDVLRYLFQGGSWFAVRPSGTEPKMKIYLGAKAATDMECQTVLAALNHAVERYQS